MPTLCEICNARPAVARVTVVQDGERKTMSICDYDYRQLLRHQEMLNPFDSLLGGGGLSRFFRGLGGGIDDDGHERFAAEVPRESVDVTDAFSEQTLELLQHAAEKAHELRRNELDTEHLLYVLADTDVGTALLKELKLSPQDIRGYIDQHAQTGTAGADASLERMSISPRLKKVFQYAFQASRDRAPGSASSIARSRPSCSSGPPGSARPNSPRRWRKRCLATSSPSSASTCRNTWSATRWPG
ncbi:Clp amino terminal domain protein [compost metagenome]